MYKIIIVDDEMIVRHAVKTLISWDGGRFEYAGSAASGAAALELAARTDVDIVITDIKMAEMDGIELIKKLMAAGFSGEILVLSNYNDFDLVREALKCGAHDYMLKLTLTSDGFMKTLEEIADKLDQKKNRKLELAYVPDKPKPQSELRKDLLKRMDLSAAASNPFPFSEEDRNLLNLSLDNACCYSFSIGLQDSGPRQTNEAPNMFEMLEKLADGLFPNRIWLEVIPSRANRFLLFAVCPLVKDMVDPAELAHRMIRLSEMYYNLSINVIYNKGVSSRDDLLGQMNLDRQAEELLFYTKNRIGYFSNTERLNEINDPFKAAESRLRDSLAQSGAAGIELWVENAQLLIETSSKGNISPKSLKRAIVGGVWGIVNAAASKGSGSWNEKKWIEQIEMTESDTQLMMLIKAMSEEISEMVGKSAHHSYKREEIRSAIAYLEEHYSERISISDVASHVGFSEPYLCQVFKTETGYSILSMLNEIRMNKAYEMLTSGKYLIKQAALEVGIPDPFYFNRLFKKKYGIAPKNVKNIQQSEDVEY